jgi:hypothetical protein
VARDGAVLDADYLDLLQRATTVDYHAGNAQAYQVSGRPVRTVRFGHSPYLEAPSAPLEERPIDVLFLGIVTERRAAVLRTMLAAGVNVMAPSTFLYGEERDAMVRQAKVVVNISAYDSTRFEQVRASVVLSCGTPVVTEDRSWQHDDDTWVQPYLHRFDPRDPAAFFHGSFGSPDFFDTSRRMLAGWRSLDVSEGYRALLDAPPALRHRGAPLLTGASR